MRKILDRRAICFLIVSLSIWLTNDGRASEQIYVIEIEGLHQKDGDGKYDSILQGAIVSENLDIEMIVLPPGRAFRKFKSCETCCISPANKNKEFYDYPGSIETLPMNEARVVIFSLPGGSVFSKIEQLVGLRVNGRLGMPYGKTIESSGLPLGLARTIEGNIKMLQRGRIDAFIAYIPDAYDAFLNLGLDPFPHTPDNPIVVHQDALLCRGKNADYLVKKFNNFLSRSPN